MPALEQRHAKLLLERLDLPGKRRLREEQIPRRARERKVPCRGVEALQQIERRQPRRRSVPLCHSKYSCKQCVDFRLNRSSVRRRIVLSHADAEFAGRVPNHEMHALYALKRRTTMPFDFTTRQRTSQHLPPATREPRPRRRRRHVISVDSGCLWVTLENDPRDIVLRQGHALRGRPQRPHGRRCRGGSQLAVDAPRRSARLVGRCARLGTPSRALRATSSRGPSTSGRMAPPRAALSDVAPAAPAIQRERAALAARVVCGAIARSGQRFANDDLPPFSATWTVSPGP